MPSADELLLLWPEDALAHVEPDLGTAVVVLTHDDKFDLPMIRGALASDAFYVGWIGSRRNQERRRDLLREEGMTDDELGADLRSDRTRHRREHAGRDRRFDPRRDHRRARGA